MVAWKMKHLLLTVPAVMSFSMQRAKQGGWEAEQLLWNDGIHSTWIWWIFHICTSLVCGRYHRRVHTTGTRGVAAGNMYCTGLLLINVLTGPNIMYVSLWASFSHPRLLCQVFEIHPPFTETFSSYTDHYVGKYLNTYLFLFGQPNRCNCLARAIALMTLVTFIKLSFQFMLPWMELRFW